MPKPGQKTVTLNKKIYEIAKENAEKHGKSVAGFVTELIEKKTNKEAKTDG